MDDLAMTLLVARFERDWGRVQQSSGAPPRLEQLLDTLPVDDRYEAFVTLSRSDVGFWIELVDRSTTALRYLYGAEFDWELRARLRGDTPAAVALVLAEYHALRRIGDASIHAILKRYEKQPFSEALKNALPKPKLVPCPGRDAERRRCPGQIEIGEGLERADLTCPTCGLTPTRLGQYLVDPEPIGVGAYGEVFCATQLYSALVLALKKLRPEHRNSPDALERFHREAKYAANLPAIPGLVHPYLLEQDGDNFFITYNLIDGGSLREYLDERGKALGRQALPVREAARIVASLARTLHEVHRAGVFHRDVKPENVLIDAQGNPHLTDFGLATSRDDRDRDARTRAGTPAYMAPEQINPTLGEIDAPTDVYALAVLLHELVSGHRPAEGTTGAAAPNVKELHNKVVAGDLRRLPVGHRLRHVCARALRTDPARRYPSALAFARAIERATGPRLRLRVVATTALLLGVGIAAAWWLRQPIPDGPEPPDNPPRVHAFHSIVRKHGRLVGVGPVPLRVAGRHRAFVLVERPDSADAEALDGEGKPTIGEGIVSLLPASAEYLAGADPNRESCWRVVAAGRGSGEIKEVVFDDNDRQIYNVVYNKGPVERQFHAYFRDEAGQSRNRGTSGADHVIITRTADGYDETILYRNSHGFPVPDDRGAFGERRVPGPDGLPTKVTLLDKDGITPRLGRLGYSSVEYEYRDGLCISERYLDLANKEVCLPKRYSKVTRAYDPATGNLTAESYFAPDGAWIACDDGYAGRRFTYDNEGRPASTTFVDENGRECINTDLKCASVRFAYPDAATVVVTYHRVGGRLIRSKEGFARAEIHLPGKEGNLKVSFADENGKPTSVALGYPSLGGDEVERGNPIRWVRLGSGDQRLDTRGLLSFTLGPKGMWAARREARDLVAAVPEPEAVAVVPRIAAVSTEPDGSELDETRMASGYTSQLLVFRSQEGSISSKVRIVRDPRGLVVESTNLDADGKLRPTKANGLVSTRVSHDARGLRVREEYRDVNGDLCPGDDGYAVAEFKYDPLDRLSLVRYSGDGKAQPPYHSGGYSSVKYVRDTLGDLLETTFLDEKGKTVAGKDGVAKIVNVMNTYRDVVETRYLDASDKPVNPNGKAARVIHTYDQRGRVSWKERDQDGKPVRTAGLEYALDTYTIERRDVGDGNILYRVAILYFAKTAGAEPTREFILATVDPHNKVVRAIVHKPGREHRERDHFDEHQNPVRTEFIDANDKLVLDRDGVAGYDSIYDAGNHEVGRKYFGLDGKTPARRRQGYYGWILDLDEQGREVRQCYTDVAGKPVRTHRGFAIVERVLDVKGRTVRESYLDEHTSPVRSTDGYAAVTTDYATADDTRTRKFLDERNRPIRRALGNYGEVEEYDAQHRVVRRTLLGIDGRPVTGFQSYATIAFRYDDHGDPVGVKYFDSSDRPSRHVDGESGSRSTYVNGLETSRVFVDEEGKAVRLKKGYAGWKSTYDAKGQEIRCDFIDEAGEPTTIAKGYASYSSEYDSRGNEVMTRYFDVSGKPVLRDPGYHACALTYDAHGYRSSLAFLDTRDRLISTLTEPARTTERRDAAGNIVEVRFYGPDGSPTLRQGIQGWTAAYDAAGHATEVHQFDVGGKLVPNQDNSGWTRSTYDERGNPITWVNLDDEERPVPTANGYARTRSSYDASGNAVAVHYLDANGKPVRARFGYATQFSSFDPQGRLSSEWYHDEHDRPARNADGVYRRIVTYPSTTTNVESYGGADGQAVDSPEGYSQVRTTTDGLGRNVVIEYLDKAGRPARRRGTYQRVEHTYGAGEKRIRSVWSGYDPAGGFSSQTESYEPSGNGKQTTQTWQDLEGRDVTRPQGYARIVLFNDENGNQLSETYRDLGGRPTRHQGGYYGLKYANDHRGFRLSKTYTDAAGQPIVLSDGYAQQAYVNDDRGNHIRVRYLDAEGKPTRHTDGNYAVAYEYDEHNRQTKTMFLDAAGKPMRVKLGNFGWTCTYDNHGWMSSFTYRDAAGQPLVLADGFARQDYVNDDRGNHVRASFFDATGKPTRQNEGAYAVAYEYDDHNRQTKTMFLDAAGKPMQAKLGNFGWSCTYDDLGHMSSVTYLDAAGQPLVLSEGYARQDYVNDDRGNRVRVSYFDAAGKPTRHTDGSYAVAYEYDDHNRQTKAMFLDAAGKPMRVKLGNFGWSCTYDDHGRTSSFTYLDAAGQPLVLSEGYARQDYVNDDRGNRVRVSYFDAAGKPTRHTDGNYAVAYEYDDHNRQTKATFLDAAGEPTQIKLGNFGWTRAYDDHGRVSSFTTTNASGHPMRLQGGYARTDNVYDSRGDLKAHLYFDEAGKRLDASVTVAVVLPGSNAEMIGLRKGDVILGFDDEAIGSTLQLRWIMLHNLYAPWTAIVVREGRVLLIDVPEGSLGAMLNDQVVEHQ